MSQPIANYKNHRFPPEIIARAVWLYCRFPLSLRHVEETTGEYLWPKEASARYAGGLLRRVNAAQRVVDRTHWSCL